MSHTINLTFELKNAHEYVKKSVPKTEVENYEL